MIEHVGEATWERSLKCLARGGCGEACGATTGYKAGIDLRFLFSRQFAHGLGMGTKGELLRARALLLFRRRASHRGSDVSVVEAAAAQRAFEAGKQFGKVVLEA